MKKILNTTIYLDGKKHRVNAILEDVNGYISITGEVYRPHAKKPSICGCVHDYIIKAFPQLEKYIPLHLVNTKTFLPMYAYENALYHIANGNADHAQKSLLLNNDEMRELVALVTYGLQGSKKSYGVIYEEQSQKVFNNQCEKFGVADRYSKLMAEFYNQYNQ